MRRSVEHDLSLWKASVSPKINQPLHNLSATTATSSYGPNDTQKTPSRRPPGSHRNHCPNTISHSLSAQEDPANPFQFVLDFRIVASAQPDRPITLLTSESAFQTQASSIEHSSFDLDRGTFSLICVSDPYQKFFGLANGCQIFVTTIRP